MYDIEKLRNDLINFFGTAMNNGYPMAVIELSEVQGASQDELIQIAISNGFDVQNYVE